MRKLVFLRFLLDNMQFFMVQADEQDAREFVRRWQEGRLPPIISAKELPSAAAGMDWAVRASSIMCLHTVLPEHIQQQQAAQQSQQQPRGIPSYPPYGGGPNLSGI